MCSFQIIISFLYNFRPVQDYFSSYETDKSVTRRGGGRGGGENPEKTTWHTHKQNLGCVTCNVRLINWAATYDEVSIVLVMVVAKAILLFSKKKKKKKEKILSSRISYQTTLPAPIAQVVERPLRDRGVTGSILGRAIPKA